MSNNPPLADDGVMTRLLTLTVEVDFDPSVEGDIAAIDYARQLITDAGWSADSVTAASWGEDDG